MFAAENGLLTDVVERLHEFSKKINIVDQLSRHLKQWTPDKAAAVYLRQVKNKTQGQVVAAIKKARKRVAGNFEDVFKLGAREQ